MIPVADSPAVVEYVEARVGSKFSPPYSSLGFLRLDGTLRAGFVFNGYNESNIEVSIAAEPGSMLRSDFRFVAQYVFEQLGCRRMTIRTRRRNKKAVKMAAKAGFRWEAMLKSYFPDDDAVLFRMTRDECRYL